MAHLCHNDVIKNNKNNKENHPSELTGQLIDTDSILQSMHGGKMEENRPGSSKGEWENACAL
jgi:hypothetical protein